MSNTVHATGKYIRMSPMKIRDVIRFIRGMNAEKAQQYLTTIPGKAPRLILKVLKSAMANAEHNNNLSVSELKVLEATANQGPTIKRFMPVARGSAHPIHKSTTHINIILSSNN